jgi:hypothetical protein
MATTPGAASRKAQRFQTFKANRAARMQAQNAGTNIAKPGWTQNQMAAANRFNQAVAGGRPNVGTNPYQSNANPQGAGMGGYSAYGNQRPNVNINYTPSSGNAFNQAGGGAMGLSNQEAQARGGQPAQSQYAARPYMGGASYGTGMASTNLGPQGNTLMGYGGGPLSRGQINQYIQNRQAGARPFNQPGANVWGDAMARSQAQTDSIRQQADEIRRRAAQNRGINFWNQSVATPIGVPMTADQLQQQFMQGQQLWQQYQPDPSLGLPPAPAPGQPLTPLTPPAPQAPPQGPGGINEPADLITPGPLYSPAQTQTTINQQAAEQFAQADPTYLQQYFARPGSSADAGTQQRMAYPQGQAAAMANMYQQTQPITDQIANEQFRLALERAQANAEISNYQNQTQHQNAYQNFLQQQAGLYLPFLRQG